MTRSFVPCFAFLALLFLGSVDLLDISELGLANDFRLSHFSSFGRIKLIGLASNFFCRYYGWISDTDDGQFLSLLSILNVSDVSRVSFNVKFVVVILILICNRLLNRQLATTPDFFELLCILSADIINFPSCLLLSLEQLLLELKSESS